MLGYANDSIGAMQCILNVFVGKNPLYKPAVIAAVGAGTVTVGAIIKLVADKPGWGVVEA